MATAVLHRPSRAIQGRRWWVRWLIRLVVAVLVTAFLGVVAVIVLIMMAPSVANAPQKVQAILTSHNAPSDNGVIPDKLATALLATENSRYYEDPALDPLGVARTSLGLITGNGNDGGATIEQQLAKMLYAPGTGVGAESRQVGAAFRLDQKYSKNQILAMYLNAAYFGDGAYGVVGASEHYFGVPPANLSWAQASLLAGLVQAPTEYDPHGHLSLARSRQSHVLARLVATHHLSASEAAQVYLQPLDPAVSFYG